MVEVIKLDPWAIGSYGQNKPSWGINWGNLSYDFLEEAIYGMNRQIGFSF